MSVHSRSYRGYAGPITDTWSRFTVISRYALRDVFASRLFVGFFVACFVPPLVAAVMIYLHYNIEALTILDLQALDLIQIDSTFFRFGVLIPQMSFAFVLILIVGPALVSPDLRNNAMPLYLSRPLSKTDYVVGKLVVLLFLASLVTWVPGLSLFFLQSYLAGSEWVMEHGRIGPALFLSFCVWIVALSIFALAVSAWVKWKPWARIAFLGILFIATAMGQVFKLIYSTWWGGLIVFGDVTDRVFAQLFGLPGPHEMPAAAAWFALIAFIGLSLVLLYRRIRAFEVIS